jgi:hypothetical protein
MTPRSLEARVEAWFALEERPGSLAWAACVWLKASGYELPITPRILLGRPVVGTHG